MDSVSQLALGAAVTVAVMGRRTAVWKTALWGGVAGTLPDVDALIDHGDSVLNMVLHRSESHALLYLTLLSGPLAWLVSRLADQGRWVGRWWLALWLALITHPLLDLMTVYGTQLGLPFTRYPFGVGSIFIIDPLYTLPLLVGVVAALVQRREGGGLRWNQAGLALSTLYLAWGVAAQQHVTQIVQPSLPEPGQPERQLLVTPTPFNSVLWRLVVVTPTHYYEGFYSLLDDDRPVRWAAHARGAELFARYREADPVDRIARFSHGFFAMRQAPDGALFITDLRMGQEPTYTFNFRLGTPEQLASGATRTTQQWQRPDVRRALPWLWQRLLGRDVTL